MKIHTALFGISSVIKCVKSDHYQIFGSVYFAISGNNTAGAVLSLGERNWLNLSCDMHDVLGLV